MPEEERKATLDDWLAGRINVVVGTEAFGLGVDFVFRRVIVLGLPFTLRSLWQKLGRGGRDEQPATGCLYWNWQDTQDRNWMVKLKKSPEIVELARVDFDKVLRWVPASGPFS